MGPRDRNETNILNKCDEYSQNAINIIQSAFDFAVASSCQKLGDPFGTDFWSSIIVKVGKIHKETLRFVRTGQKTDQNVVMLEKRQVREVPLYMAATWSKPLLTERNVGDKFLAPWRFGAMRRPGESDAYEAQNDGDCLHNS